MSTLEVRDAVEEDWPGIRLLTGVSYGANWRPETFEAWRALMPSGGSVIVADGPDVVGMAHYLDFSMTVPGGVQLPCAGITWVGVAPTHRRRGLLRAMYTELHQRISDGGYPIAALTATEGGIYGRFGYGVATLETGLTLDRRFARFHGDVPDPGGVRIVRPREHRDALVEIYDRFRRVTPGAQVRPAALWDDLLADWEDSRGGGTPWFCLLHADGYALYRMHRGSVRSVRVEEFTAATSDAHIAMWRALAGIDLAETVSVAAQPRDPVLHLFTDSRVLRTTAVQDELWLRIMDVRRALEARTYAADLAVVLEVNDEFRSDGGRFELTVSGGRARCVRTDAAADLALDLDVLSSLYFGVQSAATLAAAGRIRGDGAESLDAALRSDVPPRIGFHF